MQRPPLGGAVEYSSGRQLASNDEEQFSEASRVRFPASGTSEPLTPATSVPARR